MSQKTSLTALTVDYADRWNSIWFAELSVFSMMLGLPLQFIILSYGINNFCGIFIIHFTQLYTSNFPLDFPIGSTLKEAFDWFYSSATINKNHLWNMIVGSSCSRCLYFVLLGLCFLKRNRHELTDEDNLWLFHFIEKNKERKNNFEWLDYHKGFFSWTLVDRQLVRVILSRVYWYCLPLTCHLLWVKEFHLTYFVMGFCLMIYFQSLLSVGLFAYTVCTAILMAFYSVFIVEDFPVNYRKNFAQYTSIVLTVNFYYNFFSLLFLFAFYGFANIYWLKIIAFFVMSSVCLIYLTPVIFSLIYISNLLVDSLRVRLFRYKAPELTETEALLKKSKLFFFTCVLIGHVLLTLCNVF